MCFRYVLNDEGNIVTASTADHDYGQVIFLLKILFILSDQISHSINKTYSSKICYQFKILSFQEKANGIPIFDPTGLRQEIEKWRLEVETLRRKNYELKIRLSEGKYNRKATQSSMKIG